MNTWRMVLAAMLTAAALGAADPPEELAALRKQWETQKATVEAERAAAVERAVSAYEGELRALLANVRRRGDLDYVSAILGEMKRLEADRSAPAKPADKRMEHLRKAQWGARQAEDRADKEREGKLGKLEAEHAARLEALEKRFVKENRIEDAKAAREEREGIAAMRAIAGEWLGLGKFARTVAADGRIFDKGNPKPVGTCVYQATMADRRTAFGMNFFGGKHVYGVTMDENGKRLEWSRGGRLLSATRMEE